jgi:hypothetical protein
MKRTPQQRVDEHNTLVRALDAVGAVNTMSELPSHDPGAHRNLSGVQFRHYPGDSSGFNHRLIAKNSEGKSLGHISWNGRSGRVDQVYVPHEYQGLGVATSLWERAHKLADMGQAPAPKHSNDRTLAGDEWASKMGGKKPMLNSGRGWSAEQRRKLFGK